MYRLANQWFGEQKIEKYQIWIAIIKDCKRKQVSFFSTRVYQSKSLMFFMRAILLGQSKTDFNKKESQWKQLKKEKKKKEKRK